MKNKIILLAITLILVLACGMPAEELESIQATYEAPIPLPTYYPLPTKTPLPTITPQSVNTPEVIHTLPTPEIAHVVGSWHVRREPNEHGLVLAVLEDVFVHVAFRSNGWALIEYGCFNVICYGWINQGALED